jgi:hypothetical protein
MEKHAATTSVRRRRLHLAEMATRGTEHEKSVATEKLKRLDSKYHFSDAPEIKDGDIFEGWKKPSPSRQSHPVLKVEKEWQDAANLVKWVFQDKFKTSSGWRSLPTGVELMLDAGKADTARFKPFAADLHATIVAACSEFSCGRAVRELDRSPFLQGLYDGLIDETRTSGTMMPGFSPFAKPKRPRKKKSAPPPTNAPTVHPYDLGRDVGMKLRINVPREELCESIRFALNPQEGHPHPTS